MSVDPAGLETPTARRARLVLGTAGLGDSDATVEVLDRFSAGGGQALDLANVYGDGEANRAVGRWLTRQTLLPGLYVKGCHPPYCRPELIREEVDKARSDLGVDRLDVFVLHRDDETVPVHDFAEALRAEVRRGSIETFGVSNWTLTRFMDLDQALGHDRTRLSAFSNHFSLAALVSPDWPGCLDMGPADIATLAARGTTILAWASLASGYFAGRPAPAWSSPSNERRRRSAHEIASARGTSTTAVALAYVLDQPGGVRPVVGARSARHIAELLDATRLRLTPAEVARLMA